MSDPCEYNGCPRPGEDGGPCAFHRAQRALYEFIGVALLAPEADAAELLAMAGEAAPAIAKGRADLAEARATRGPAVTHWAGKDWNHGTPSTRSILAVSCPECIAECQRRINALPEEP